MLNVVNHSQPNMSSLLNSQESNDFILNHTRSAPSLKTQFSMRRAEQYQHAWLSNYVACELSNSWPYSFFINIAFGRHFN